jgi:hypothetical protein
MFARDSAFKEVLKNKLIEPEEALKIQSIDDGAISWGAQALTT